MEEVLLELDNDEDDVPMSVGSHNEFDDIAYEEKEKNECVTLDPSDKVWTIKPH